MKKKAPWNFLLLSGIFFVTQVCCGQAAKTSVSKEQALKGVKVKSVSGWKETVSDDGRFRILFPGDAVYTIDEARTMPGFELRSGDMHWFVYYVDYPNPASDEAQIRGDFRRSMEAIANKHGNVLKRMGDVALNGRPGFDALIEGPVAKSFMRGFLVGHRFYTLEVDVRGGTDGDETPKGVQQFFDSFTFWE